ncbi:FecCD family ABC transporter permease [Stackebrandtia nassauensis]|uniref:Transport system permease protein n=1 Tax=Stackebrandtia nassauensis (strain DSM 44728 / CIP 108903 / NRRL B-16338 / NBRC 102104 / LLR-40K-21) TaxID=446470 RepID=D3Q461_STANL|nr:transport system permease protein [Stackebrandtia nassauensis DSM 44728]
MLIGCGVLVAALVAGVALGPVSLPPGSVALELVDHIPGVEVVSGLSEQQGAIVWNLRLPRVVLGLLVGAMLALAGGCYQGVFRNPLADPMLLGVAAGAGLGATLYIVARAGGMDLSPRLLPLAAFVGAMAALAATYLLGAGSAKRGAGTLILAGVAVSAFLSAAQTYVQQRNVESLDNVYSWLLGRLGSVNWSDVAMLLPYVAVTGLLVLLRRRELDVLSLGDTEAAALGLHPRRSRLILLTAASLGTAAAVSVSGLIGFVGVVVPHIVRLLAGRSYRSILPLSLVFGGAFLVLADLAARTVVAPAELPIGVVTAFIGAPFFVLVMRTSTEVRP